MSYARQMLDTYPRALTVDASMLAAVIDAITDCAQACITDTDADLGEQNPDGDDQVHRLCLDCADVCTATAGVTSARPATTPMSPSRCWRHAWRSATAAVRSASGTPDARALPGLRRGLPALPAGLPRAPGRPEIAGPPICGASVPVPAHRRSRLAAAG